MSRVCWPGIHLVFIHFEMWFATPPKSRLRCHLYPANTKHLYNICTISAQRLRRWFNIAQMLHKFMFRVCWVCECNSPRVPTSLSPLCECKWPDFNRIPKYNISNDQAQNLLILMDYAIFMMFDKVFELLFYNKILTDVYKNVDAYLQNVSGMIFIHLNLAITTALSDSDEGKKRSCINAGALKK